MTDAELKSYFAAYTDNWKFFHKYVGQLPQPNVEFWMEVKKDLLALVEKHKDVGQDRFAEKMFLATLDELSRLNGEVHTYEKQT